MTVFEPWYMADTRNKNNKEELAVASAKLMPNRFLISLQFGTGRAVGTNQYLRLLEDVGMISLWRNIPLRSAHNVVNLVRSTIRDCTLKVSLESLTLRTCTTQTQV